MTTTTWFVTIKFPESMTGVMKIKHAELIQEIRTLPFSSNWEFRSPDLHMLCIDDQNQSFRKATNRIFRGQDVYFQRLDDYRAADIANRFLKGHKKKRDRQDRAYRQKHNLRFTERNNISGITWSRISAESKEKISSLIKRYKRT